MRLLRLLCVLAIASGVIGCRSTDMNASAKAQAGHVKLRHLGVELGDVHVSAKVQVSVD